MQGNNMDEIWRDKLGAYQAPADPQDWADMAALLDAKEEKRIGFFWLWLVAAALMVTVGGGFLIFMQTQNEQIDAFAITGSNSNNNYTNAADATTADSNGETASGNNINTTAENDNAENNNNDLKAGNKNIDNLSNTEGINDLSTNSITNNKPLSKKGKDKNKKNNHSLDRKQNTQVDKIDSDINIGQPDSRVNQNNVVSNTDGADAYDKLLGTINIKRLKALPNPLVLALSKDTTKHDFNNTLMKHRNVQHYLGLSTGWVHARVDRSADFRPGYNVGLQYSMMIKNRAGFHMGMAYRQYRYYTDLVVCNYDIYQCPTSYNSTLQAIDLNIGAQVNLVKNNKVEWYVMGGISNQFMMQETFEYNLPKIDTTNPQPVPQVPPTNTSFIGAGSSDFESSFDASGFSPQFSDPNNENAGKFIRERYLGAWYAGTGVTWHFNNRMSVQVEPIVGRTFQFVGIQDKKLWQTGVNMRFNVRLGR